MAEYNRTFETYEEENIAYWSKRADGYSRVNQEELQNGQREVWSAVLSSEIDRHYPDRDRSEIRILDVGTGPGFFAIILTEMGYDVTAVDYTEEMLVQARRNAGELAECIDFRQMNAEKLAFGPGQFDVLVTRNLTWNLPNPEKAYQSWANVLKPNGLLLNFDANWYRYLYDADARDGHQEDRANITSMQAADETEGTDVDAMEAIAYQTPMAQTLRPLWDLRVLEQAGMTAEADEEIWKTVWTENERINNSSTPMFLVRGIKNV